jgi:hypothetical protein
MEGEQIKKFVYVSGQRGQPKLVVGGFSFVRNKGNSATTYWRCSKMRAKKCKAKVIINNALNKIFLTNPEHNHPQDFSECTTMSLDLSSG